MNPAPLQTEPPKADAPKPTRPTTILWQRFVLTAFKAASRGVQSLPRRSALRMGAALGRTAYRVDKRRRHYANRNLRLAYGDTLSPAEREAITRATFAHWGTTVFEFLRTAALGPEAMDALVAGVEGWEHVVAAQASSSGLIVVTGHLGNFEFLGRYMAAHGLPSTVIVREPADPAFAAYLRGIREYGGNVALGKGAASVRVLLSLLKKGQTVTLGIDQNSGDLFVPFFGVPAGTVAGPALLALRTGAPLLPAFCLLDPDDRYRLIFLPPIHANSTGDREADTARTMTEVNAVLEGVVRRCPEQWLWIHNRWKSAFQEKNRSRWPEGADYEAALQRWNG